MKKRVGDDKIFERKEVKKVMNKIPTANELLSKQLII